MDEFSTFCGAKGVKDTHALYFYMYEVQEQVN